MPEGTGYQQQSSTGTVAAPPPTTPTLGATDTTRPVSDPERVADRLFDNLLDHIAGGSPIPGLTTEGFGLGFDIDSLVARYETVEVDDDDEAGHLPDFDDYTPAPGIAVDPFDDDQLGEIIPGRDGVPEGLQYNAARGAAAARRILGFTGTIGGLGHRTTKSDHPDGNAIDLMTGADIETGQRNADFFVANHDELGVTYVIFNGQIASPRDNWAWRPYKHPAGRTDPTAMHADHVHVSFKGSDRASGRITRPRTAPPTAPATPTATRPAQKKSTTGPRPAPSRTPGAPTGRRLE